MSKVAREESLNPEIRHLALNILNQYNTKSHNYLDEAWAIGDFVKKKVNYLRDPSTSELLQSPTMMARQIESNGKCFGDCDDMALLIACLLIAVGCEPYFRAVRYEPGYTHFNHIYVVVIDKNFSDNKSKRLSIDAIVKDKPIGYEIEHYSGQDFKIV